MKTKAKTIAITLGDPCSIGAEVTKKALKNLGLPLENFILIGNKKTFGEIPEGLGFIDIEAKQLNMGQPSKDSGKVAFSSIESAINLALNEKIQAIVTAPISKYALSLAGYNYSGHTEIFDKFLKRPNFNAEMLFAARDLRVLLLTRHIPLSKVPGSITTQVIKRKVLLLNEDLKKFGIKKPRLALCGLNPHAGEQGLLGKEEIEVFEPAVKDLQNMGVNITDPLSADTLFAKASKAYFKQEQQPYDCYISSFHDQGLTAIKSIDIDKAVNITLGLKILRTSPSHGTAFDIAGKNIACSKSMEESIKTAYNFLN